jgi:hypothetical protein
MSVASAAHAVDLTTIAFRRATGAAITHGDRWLEQVAIGRRRTVILETLGRGRGIDSFRDEPGDVDDSLALVDADFDMIADSHHRRRLRGRSVDAHVAAATGRGGTLAGLGDPHSLQPLVDAH